MLVRFGTLVAWEKKENLVRADDDKEDATVGTDPMSDYLAATYNKDEAGDNESKKPASGGDDPLADSLMAAAIVAWH